MTDMTSSRWGKALDHLRQVALAEPAAVSDARLLEHFVDSKDEAAFAALVRRHGPLVWGVCRRTLGRHHDAEDAFQATFLVLARKAASVRPRELIANWLYGVAYRTALKARAAGSRRARREKQVQPMPEPQRPGQDAGQDLAAIIDQELAALPDKHRAVIVLCDLEDRTGKEAAARLRIPEGTVASRLRTARRLLG